MNKGYRSDDESYKLLLNIVCGPKKATEANLRNFKKAIKELPWEKKSNLMRYFGLDGGFNYYEHVMRKRRAGMFITASEVMMEQKADRAIKELRSPEFMRMFHEGTRELVKEIAKKTYGESDELTAIKWVEVYVIMILNGSFLAYDETEDVRDDKWLEREKEFHINRTTILAEVYENFIKNLKNGEILIPVIKGWVENLDIDDQITVLNFFGLEVPEYLKEYSGKEIDNFLELRRFKEKIFPNGRWASDGFLFLRRGIPDEETVKSFCEIFRLRREGTKYQLAEPEIYNFGTGKKMVRFFTIQDGEKEAMAFPDPFEIFSIFPLWDHYKMA